MTNKEIPIYLTDHRTRKLLDANRVDDVEGGSVWLAATVQTKGERDAFLKGLRCGLGHQQLSALSEQEASAVRNAPYFLREAKKRYGKNGWTRAIWRRPCRRSENGGPLIESTIDAVVAVSKVHEFDVPLTVSPDTVPFRVNIAQESILPFPETK